MNSFNSVTGSLFNLISKNKHIIRTNIIDTLVKFSNQFIMIPVFLLSWDTNIYGSWLSILAIAGTMQIFINSITDTYSLDLANLRSFKGKLLNFSSNYLILFILFSILTIFFSSIIYYYNYIYSPKELYLDKTIIILISLLSSSLIDGLSSLKISSFRFKSDYNSFLLYERLLVILKLIFTLFSLYILNFDPLNLSLVLFITSLIFFLLLNFNRNIELKLNFNKINKISLKKTASKILKRLLIISGSNFKYSYEILILSFFFQPQYLANTVTLYTLARSLTFLNSQLKLFFLEILSLQFIRKKNKQLLKNHNLLILLSLTTSIFFSILLFFFGKNIYEIWTLNKLDFDLNILVLFLVSVNLRLLWVDKSFLIDIFNRLENFSYVNFLMVIIFIFITYLLVKNYSIYGFGISLITYELIMVFAAFYFHKKNLLNNLSNLSKNK